MTASSSPSPLAARVALVSLVFLLGVTPPEARGEATAGCALLVVLAGLLGWPAAPRRGLWALVIVLLLAVPLARSAQSPGAALEPLALVCVALGAGLAAAGLAGVPGLGRTVAAALAATAGVVSLHAMYQELWGLERVLAQVAADPGLPGHAALLERLQGGRAFASFLTPAALGGYLALAMPVTAALGLEARGRRRFVWFALVILQAGAFMATASGTAAAALLGATLFAACVGARVRRFLVLATALAGLLLVGVALQRGGIALRPEDPAGPWRLRAGNFSAAWAMAADHPWIGVGPGGFAERYATYRQPGDNETRHVHDLPLELAAELGWPLAAIVTILFFGLFLGPLATETHGPGWRRGLAVGLAAFSLHNLGDFTAFLPSMLWLAALLRGTLAHPVTSRHAVATVPDRIAQGLVLAGVSAAVAVAGLSGLADERRIDARFAAAAGDDHEVLRLAARARSLAPWEPDAALLLARAVERLHGPLASDLPSLADRAVALSPVRSAARELRARVRLARGDVAGAYADLQQAVQLYPRHEGYAREAQARRVELDAMWLAGDGSP